VYFPQKFVLFRVLSLIKLLSDLIYANDSYAGCLQLLEILEISRNLKTLLEIREITWNLIGPPGNFCIRCQRSTALVSSHKNMDKYFAQKYVIAIICGLSSSRCTKTRFRPGLRLGPLWGSLWRSPRFLFGWGEDTESWNAVPIIWVFQLSMPPPRRRPKQGKRPGFFLKSLLLDSPGNLLEIYLVKFVDTLLCLVYACRLCKILPQKCLDSSPDFFVVLCGTDITLQVWRNILRRQ